MLSVEYNQWLNINNLSSLCDPLTLALILFFKKTNSSFSNVFVFYLFVFFLFILLFTKKKKTI